MTGWLVLHVMMVIAVSAAMAAIPFISRRTILFAVTVEPEYRSTAASRQIILRYESIIIAVACAAVALEAVGFIAFPRNRGDASGLLILAVVILETFAYVVARRQVRASSGPSSVGYREVALTAPEPLHIFLPRPLVLLLAPYVLLVGFALWLGTHVADLPRSVPVHFTASGQPDNFISSSGWHPFAPLIFALALLITLNALMLVACQLRQLSDTPARVRIVNLVLLEIMMLVAAIMGVISILPTFMSPIRESALLPAVLVGFVVSAFIAIGFTIALGLHRIQRGHGAPREIGDRTPDQCWKLGLIYVNRRDPALLVEKRSGLGYTLNFGHPISLVILLAFVGLTLAIPFVYMHCTPGLHQTL